MVISFKIIIGGNKRGDRWKKSYELVNVVNVDAEYKRTHGTILCIKAQVFYRKRKK